MADITQISLRFEDGVEYIIDGKDNCKQWTEGKEPAYKTKTRHEINRLANVADNDFAGPYFPWYSPQQLAGKMLALRTTLRNTGRADLFSKQGELEDFCQMAADLAHRVSQLDKWGTIQAAAKDVYEKVMQGAGWALHSLLGYVEKDHRSDVLYETIKFLDFGEELTPFYGHIEGNASEYVREHTQGPAMTAVTLPSPPAAEAFRYNPESGCPWCRGETYFPKTMFGKPDPIGPCVPGPRDGVHHSVYSLAHLVHAMREGVDPLGATVRTMLRCREEK